MATTLESTAAAPAAEPAEFVERLLTIADVAELPQDLPSGHVRYELEDGRLIVMSPTGASHGRVEARLAHLLVEAAKKFGGEAFSGEIGIILSRKPDTLFGGDAAYYAPASLPLRESREGFIETPPDLVVEVRSKNERPGRIKHKVSRYLAAGAKEVWYAEPATRELTVHKPDTEPRTYRAGEVLTTGLIPGIEFPLSDIFG